MSIKPWFAAFALAAVLALPGCDRAPPSPDTAAPGAGVDGALATAPAAPMDATWQGVLPCSDCDGIQTRLHLVADDQGRQFQLEETYLAGNDGEVFEGQGPWFEESAVIRGEPTTVYRLDADGASRWFALQPDGALEMLEDRGQPTADGLAHRLQRL